jgi:hypothetical protein
VTQAFGSEGKNLTGEELGLLLFFERNQEKLII